MLMSSKCSVRGHGYGHGWGRVWAALHFNQMLGFKARVDTGCHPYSILPCLSAQTPSSCIGLILRNPQISLCVLPHSPPHNWDRKARPTSCCRHQARTQLARAMENPVPCTVYTILGLLDFMTLVKPVPAPPPTLPHPNDFPLWLPC